MSTAPSTASMSTPFGEGRRQPARDNRRAGNAVFPADDLAALQAGGNRCRDRPADRYRAGCPLRGVHTIFTGPSTCWAMRRGDHHVGLQPAPEAAADQVIVHGHFLDRQTRSFRSLRLGTRRDLRPGPDLAGVGLERGRCSSAAPSSRAREKAIRRTRRIVRRSPSALTIARRFGDGAVLALAAAGRPRCRSNSGRRSVPRSR